MYNIKIDYKQKSKTDGMIVMRNSVFVTFLNAAEQEILHFKDVLMYQYLWILFMIHCESFLESKTIVFTHSWNVPKTQNITVSDVVTCKSQVVTTVMS